MTSTSLSVISYNMGSDIRDYKLLWRHTNPKTQPTDLDYKNAQIKVAELLKEKADVYCLQEAPPAQDGCPLIDALKERNFKIIRAKDSSESVIAIDMNKFTYVDNKSMGSNRAIAMVIHNAIGKKIVLASVHPGGFQFTDSTAQLQQDYDSMGSLYENDNEIDFFTHSLAKLNADMYIVGADMNATPEKWNNRFQYFTDNGFQTLKTHQPTAVNTNDKKDQEREIDYFFLKSKNGENLSLTHRLSVGLIEGMNGWDPAKNASDHKPLLFRIQPYTPMEIKNKKLAKYTSWISRAGCIATIARMIFIAQATTPLLFGFGAFAFMTAYALHKISKIEKQFQ